MELTLLLAVDLCLFNIAKHIDIANDFEILSFFSLVSYLELKKIKPFHSCGKLVS